MVIGSIASIYMDYVCRDIASQLGYLDGYQQNAFFRLPLTAFISAPTEHCITVLLVYVSSAC
jgi:hypothetical protein